jgi:hypothetical protein
MELNTTREATITAFTSQTNSVQTTPIISLEDPSKN